MEDNKPLVAAIIIIIVLILLGSGIGLFFYFQFQKAPAGEQPIQTNTNDQKPGLPTAGDVTDGTAGNAADISNLEKEKQFISSFWQMPEIIYSASIPAYKLPLAEIKEQVANYRDFSRKVNLDQALEKITNNGFAVISNPFTTESTDWETNYRLIGENSLPILITTDSIAGLYQDTFHIIYKEIEQEAFYPSLWQLLKEMFDQAKSRYESKYQQFGIETDNITEANRTELAYLAVALKLLQPDTNQVKESLAADKEFFSSQEAKIYKVSIPDYLTKEVDQEIKLIGSKTKNASSPIFLYQKDYSSYTVPSQYQTSELLKNYYLAITWLNESLFPLWSKSNDCQSCFLDEDDHLINFIASLYLSNDLASNQEWKNRWANIYKSVSFFKGLEANLTYLYYHQALIELFGPDYKLEEILGENLKENVAKIQEKISGYTFSMVLSGSEETKEKIGLRLLRNYHLLEDKLFVSLMEPNAGRYLKPEEKETALPFTVCEDGTKGFRCLPSGLDLFNVLSNETAKSILKETRNDQYENYQKNVDIFIGKISEFDQNTWHDNAYLSLLAALQKINDKSKSGFPTFMQTDAWAKKNLNTILATWTESHREINFEKTNANKTIGLGSYFPYGYIEPQVEFYSHLLANVEMVMTGFDQLQIISKNTKSFERLENLKIILQTVTEISKKELINNALENDDYDFINSFDKYIRGVFGDIKIQNIQNKYTFNYQGIKNNILNESISGLDQMVVIYPDAEGKLFFAIGPVFKYSESKNKKVVLTNWQKDFRP